MTCWAMTRVPIREGVSKSRSHQVRGHINLHLADPASNAGKESNIQYRDGCARSCVDHFWRIPLGAGLTILPEHGFNCWNDAMNTEPRPSYSPGLEGVIAGETSICWVDPNAGLLYRGYDIHELASQASFEEVAWLLLHGELPAVEQLAEFTRQLAAERALPSQVVSMLRQFPPGTHPMDMLRTGVSMLAAFDPDLNDHSHQANLRKAIRLITKVSTLITDGWRVAHAQALAPARPDLRHAA